MSFSKTLLATVALCGLAAAPAMARNLPPNIHFVTVGAHMSAKPALHLKSNIHDPKSVNYTQTATFSGTLSYATYFKVPVTLLGETWDINEGGGVCVQPTKQKWVGLPKRTTYAKVSTSTSTGAITSCTGTFTFQDVNYELLKKGGTSDVVTGDLEAKNFMGYNLKLVATVDITLTP